ncbi:MAG: sensor histidine kinase [Paludibacteraceae bacterium]
MSGRYIGSWVLVIALAFVVVSVLFTNNLSRQLALEEQKNVAIWAEATRQLIIADEETDINFVSSIIEKNTNIPVYITDVDGNILLSRNVKKPVDDPRTLFGPIELRITEDNVQYIYYDESNLLRLLRYVPYLQFLLIFIFITIAVWMLLTAQRGEQDRLWAGLSKETAHQLGTPISSLNAWQQLLAERYPDDDLIPQMRADINRLSTIADRFSKIGSEPELRESDVIRTLTETVDYMRTRVSSKVQIEMSVRTSQPALLVVQNVQLLEWVVENLIKNAVDAMGGAGKITIRLQEEPEEVVIDVCDNGKGMDKHTQRRIFQAGFTTKQRGWGLGLTLSKRIIEEYHRGKLFVKSSKPGVGTTFRIVLKKTENG